MNTQLVSKDAAEWSTFLSGTEHDFYHLPAYAALCANVDGGAPAGVYVEDSGRRLLMPVLLKSVRPGVLDASTPYGYSGPLTSGTTDPQFVKDAMAAARNLLRNHRVAAVFVRSHPTLSPPLTDCPGTLVNHGPTVSVDLSLSDEELWRRTSSSHRNEISKALRAGHRTFIDRHFDHFATFIEIYRTTMQRVGAQASYLFSDQYFMELRAALGDRLHLCLVEIGGQIAAAGLFVETRGLMQYHLSGTDPRFRRDRPTKIMLHFMRSWARQRGLRRLHLGGGVGAIEDSLFAFKSGFATDRHTFQTLRVVCDEAVYGSLVHAVDPSADPLDSTGYFPLYRRAA